MEMNERITLAYIVKESFELRVSQQRVRNSVEELGFPLLLRRNLFPPSIVVSDLDSLNLFSGVS